MLEALEIPRQATLLVHSAFKRLGQNNYGAEAVVAALVAYMQSGALLMPTMSWRFVKPDNPYFDELETPSNTGILTEIFRKGYASRRSLHPTHSVAGVGEGVDALLGEHSLALTPCASCSPFGKIVQQDGFILMLGVGVDCCTIIHHVEELIAPDVYVLPADKTEIYTCRDRFGRETSVNLRRHQYLPRDYWQFQDMLAASGRLKVYSWDDSICLGFRSEDMVQVVTETLQRHPRAIIAKAGQRYRMM